MIKNFLLPFLIVCPILLKSQGIQQCQEMADGSHYLFFLPEGYNENPTKKWPVILFLHGAGERGSNVEKVKVHGPPAFVEKQKDFPFILISPQCSRFRPWSTKKLNALLEEVIKNYKVDESRIYLTGLSVGGAGTWKMAMEYPTRFAAIAPICGWGNPDHVKAIKDMPVWVFHGARDIVVPLDRPVKMVKALMKEGNDVKFTIYPKCGHDSWTQTYNNPSLYEWFLSHKKDTVATSVTHRLKQD